MSNLNSSIKHLKIAALFLASIMLIQGCTAYKSSSVSLEKASISDTKTKVKTNFKKKYYFDRVVFEGGIYYGIKTLKGEIVKIRLDKNSIEKVLIKDKQKSTIFTIAAPLVLIGLVFLTTSHRFENRGITN
jgi:hypothetical protein